MANKAANSLSERIAERAKKKEKQARGGANRAEFLAVKDDIAKALDDQWPVKAIWETLREEGAISFSYDAFIGYVKRLIKTKPTAMQRASLPKPKDELGAGHKEQPATKTTDDAKPAPEPNPAPVTKSFSFNPKPKNRRDT